MAGLVDTVLGLFRRRKQQAPQLTRQQALSALPVRNPALKWTMNDDGEAVVTLPRRNDFVGKILAWLFFVPESRPVVLDEVGTFVWQHCDGEHTVEAIVQALCQEYKLAKREVELSLTEYLRTLGRRGMVGFLVPKEVARELGQDGAELLGLEDLGKTPQDLNPTGDAATQSDQSKPEAQ